jgi:hypothetical protein
MQSDPRFPMLPIQWILDVISKELNAIGGENKPKFPILECLELNLQALTSLSQQKVMRISYGGYIFRSEIRYTGFPQIPVCYYIILCDPLKIHVDFLLHFCFDLEN